MRTEHKRSGSTCAVRRGLPGWLCIPWSVVVLAFTAILLSRAAGNRDVLHGFLDAQTNLHSWSADLTQTRRLKTLTQPLVSTGRVWFAEPNKFRWEIGTPAQTIAVRSATEMLVIYPQLKRVEKYPLLGERTGQWKDTLALLEAGFPRSRADLDRQFKVLSVNSSNDTATVVLQPKSSSARRMMPQITMVFSAADFSLRATELQFGDGSTLHNDFHGARPNPALAQSLFAPAIPVDYKVVEPIKR